MEYPYNSYCEPQLDTNDIITLLSHSPQSFATLHTEAVNNNAPNSDLTSSKIKQIFQLMIIKRNIKIPIIPAGIRTHQDWAPGI